MKMNKKVFAILSTIMCLAISVTTAVGISNNYYSKTTMYFNVPNDATFQIAFPSNYLSNTSITGTTEGGATATTWISFNFTGVPQSTLQQPYEAGSSSNYQSGNIHPIMLIKNTGNCNEALAIKAVGSLPSNIAVYFNASGGATPTTTLTALTTGYQNIEASMSSTPFLNLTLYSNTSAGITTGQTTQDFYIKSTC